MLGGEHYRVRIVHCFHEGRSCWRALEGLEATSDKPDIPVLHPSRRRIFDHRNRLQCESPFTSAPRFHTSEQALWRAQSNEPPVAGNNSIDPLCAAHVVPFGGDPSLLACANLVIDSATCGSSANFAFGHHATSGIRVAPCIWLAHTLARRQFTQLGYPSSPQRSLKVP